jgi:transcription elongation factor GreB
MVGPDEIDVTNGRISIDSPVGQALLHKKVDDEVVVRKPGGEVTLYITGISSTRPQEP